MTGDGARDDPGARVFDVGAIAFDLDGTLLDTIHDLAASVNALLAELALPALPKDDIRAMVGKGIANLVQRALARASGVAPDAIETAELNDALGRYQAHYAARLGRETRAFPGMREGLERLAAMGVPLAVITNKSTRFVHPHLAQAGIEHFFKVVIGGDDLPTKKPDPAPLVHAAALLGVAQDRLLMVGDSVNDVLAARAAGSPVLVVPYGYNEGEPVQILDADGIVPSLAAVVDRIRYVSSDTR
ncbi:MAG: phosphoglycolate phosphatase [Betaproteobacteria bacterium]